MTDWHRLGAIIRDRLVQKPDRYNGVSPVAAESNSICTLLCSPSAFDTRCTTYVLLLRQRSCSSIALQKTCVASPRLDHMRLIIIITHSFDRNYIVIVRVFVIQLCVTLRPLWVRAAFAWALSAACGCGRWQTNLRSFCFGVWTLAEW